MNNKSVNIGNNALVYIEKATITCPHCKKQLEFILPLSHADYQKYANRLENELLQERELRLKLEQKLKYCK